MIKIEKNHHLISIMDIHKNSIVDYLSKPSSKRSINLVNVNKAFIFFFGQNYTLEKVLILTVEELEILVKDWSQYLKCFVAYNKQKNITDKKKKKKLTNEFEKLQFAIHSMSFPSINYKTFKDELKNGFDSFNYLSENIYAYLSSNDFKNPATGITYNSLFLINELKIKVCPYCNRNYIFNTLDQRTDQLDHYFPKSIFPFLALSFFNLVPSCATCNKIKLDKVNNLPVNPYDDRYNFDNRIKFSLKLIGSNFPNDQNSFDLEFVPYQTNIANQTIYDKHIDTFKLIDLYNHHKDIAQEIIQRTISYPEVLIKYLENKLNKNGIQVSNLDVYRIVYGVQMDRKSLGSKSLSKMSIDLHLYTLNNYRKLQPNYWDILKTFLYL